MQIVKSVVFILLKVMNKTSIA